MTAAQECQEVVPRVFFWQSYAPAVKVDLGCIAAATREGLVFIDPIPLEPLALGELTAVHRPIAILLTNGNHERAANEFRTALNIPVFAHEQAAAEIGIKADGFLKEGDSLFGGDLQVVELPGFGVGEVAIHLSSGSGAMLIGDALINIGSDGVMPLPVKYCSNAKQGIHSLRKLLAFEFETMTFAHGLPITLRPRQRLEQISAK